MAKSIRDQLSMFQQTTCDPTPNATSSQALGAGRTPCDSPDGQTTAQSGPAPARASRSPSQEKDLALTIQGTCGPTSFGSSVPDGPLSSWESRLRARLAMVGSTELPLTWKLKTTSAGRSISRLAPSMRRTSDPVSTGSQATWGTPTVQAARHASLSPAEQKRDPGNLWVQVYAATWTIPTTRDWKDTPGMAVTGPDGRLRLDQLPRQVAATWPTPRSSDEKNGNGKTGNRTPEAAAKAGWTLPELSRVTWPTPTAQPSNADGESFLRRKGRKPDGAITDLGALVLSGPTPSGSLEQTEKRGALNPQFPCWLMGYPPEWDACAPTAMPSSRKSRQK